MNTFLPIIGASRRRIIDPLSLSPALWLSDTGSDPAVWSDISGNGRNATQGTVASQPSIVAGALNGRQVRRFDGTTDTLAIAAFADSDASVLTVFSVLKHSVNTLYRNPINIGQFAYFYYASATTIGVGRQSVSDEITKVSTVNAWHIISGSAGKPSTSTISSLYVDGIGSTATTSTTGGLILNNIGRPSPSTFNGDIAEIIVFTTALSTENRQAVERYLGSKYAITVA